MTSSLVAKDSARCAVSCRSVIAVRVSGGHLCEAEAPTEPAGETSVRCAAIRFSPLVIANAVRRAAIRFLLKGNTDSFTLRVQNDKRFCRRAQLPAGKSKFSKPLLSFSALFCPLPCGNVYCGIYCG